MASSSDDERVAYAERATVSTADDSTNTNNLSLIFRVKRTQIRMMEDRGYEIDADDNEIKKMISYKEFWEFIKVKVPKIESDSTSFWDYISKKYTYDKDGVHKENLVIFLPPPQGKSFPSSRLNRYIEIVNKTPSISYLDIIYEFPLNKSTRKRLFETNRNVTTWVLSDIVSPVVDSYYVGKKMRVLSEAEYREIYAGSGIFKSQLPHIRRDDPLAKYWQWTPRMVIESLELGDLSVAVTHTLKHYVITPDSITEVVDIVDRFKTA